MGICVSSYISGVGIWLKNEFKDCVPILHHPSHQSLSRGISLWFMKENKLKQIKKPFIFTTFDGIPFPCHSALILSPDIAVLHSSLHFLLFSAHCFLVLEYARLFSCSSALLHHSLLKACGLSLIYEFIQEQ